jgi:protein-tyrosine phosphatase
VGSLLVVDGSGVCRAPIVAHSLQAGFAPDSWLIGSEVEVRGMEAEAGRSMCESAAGRLGFSGSAIAFFGSYRSLRLSVADLARADLVLTAERTQRSAVVRMLPGIQAAVFTWREALLLADVLADRGRTRGLLPPGDLVAVARALHGARGTVPLIEPPVRTGPFHWRRAAEPDALTVGSGHRPQADHARATQESVEVASALAVRLNVLVHGRAPQVAGPDRQGRLRRLLRSA